MDSNKWKNKNVFEIPYRIKFGDMKITFKK